MSEEKKEETDNVWTCKCCGYESKSGERVLSLNMGDSFQCLVCPGCYTMQLPPPVYEEFKKMMESNIVRPT
jgi:hypothetical protein